MILSLLCSAVLLTACASSRVFGGPPQTRGLQGVDDASMTTFLYAQPNGTAALAARYAKLDADIQPGNIRYNAFWTSFEGKVPSSAQPQTCPQGTSLVPANDTDKLARGYHHYHCYDDYQVAIFDDLLSRDAAIGSASTFIVYGTPDWAAHPNCTGFPWPPNPNFRLGCLPWDHLDDWEDYINFLVERYRAPWGSGRARISGLCIWNEVQSQGWSDPSPVLPNRYTGANYTQAQMTTYATIIAELMLRAGKAARRQSLDGQGVMLWLSTDHFTQAPKLQSGDVMHLGLWALLDALWPLVNVTDPWGISVHPYDAGDPRANLSHLGIYTFATLRADVAEYQCAKLVEVARISPALCFDQPQTLMWASEQGWPLASATSNPSQGRNIMWASEPAWLRSATMNKTLQARNICYAHALSLAQSLWSVTHNFFQGPVPTSQGGSGDFSLIDEPPVVDVTLSNGPGHATYDAYSATSPGVFGVQDSHYCCTQWGTGCAH